MINRRFSFRLLAIPILIFPTLLAGLPHRDASGVPAPKPKPYALLYVPKKRSLYETNHYRRRQIALIKTNDVPFILFWAIRSLKNTDLPSLPKKGKGGENRFNNAEDVAWLQQHLQVEYLEGTGVLRIALNAGNPREQALLVNAIVHIYFKLEVRRLRQAHEDGLETFKRQLKLRQEILPTVKEADKKRMELVITESKDGIEWCEIELRTLPQILDLAEVPPE